MTLKTSPSRPPSEDHGSLSLCAKCALVFLMLTVVYSIVGSVVMPIVFTTIISNVIEGIMVLTPSSELYEGWKDPDMPIYQNFYFFDIQNKDEVMQGGKPRVREAGPYTYMVNLTRSNITFSDNDTLLSYVQYMHYTFMPEMSVGAEDDIITTVNLPLMTSAVNTKYESWMARLTISAVAQIHNHEILMSMSIRDLLWGYQDPVLNQLQQLIGDDVITTDMFGLLMGQNGSSSNHFTINTGESNPFMLNRIEEWNGMTSLPWWGDDESNMINGTDGTMFYPGVKPDDTLYVFNPFSFRSMPFIYQNDSSYDDVDLYHFYIPPYAYASPDVYPPNAGFCLQDVCPPSGIFNISVCSQGVPMSLSLPHFLYGDEELINSIDGINPNETLHQNSMDIDPIMGVPFLIHQTTQINMYIEEVSGVTQTHGLPSLHQPVLWIETMGVLPERIISDYKFGLSIGVQIGSISRYSCIALGLSCLILAFTIIKCSRDRTCRRKGHTISSSKEKEAMNNEYIIIPDRDIVKTIQESETKDAPV